MKRRVTPGALGDLAACAVKSRLPLLLLLALVLALAAPVGAQEPDPPPTPIMDDGYGAPGRLFDIDIVLAFAQAILDFIGVNNLRDWVALAAGVAVTYAILAKGKTETQ